ncbi:MAG: ribonuclease III [Limnobacter sp.]|nr:ribonuclease III [Limnobacter sp.]
MDGLIRLEKELAYSFKDLGLLKLALTHRSFSASHNERLEFLGDSVLNCAAAILLFDKFSEVDEGKLSRVRSHLVRQDCLAQIGRNLSLEDVLSVGTGELKSSSTLKDSIVADAVEAIFGAILLDSGFEAAKACVIRLLTPVLNSTPIEMLGKDPKTRLQEHLQANKLKLPVYSVTVEGGTASSPEFVVECRVEDLNVKASGRGQSRRVAEQVAAELILNTIEAQGQTVKAQGGKNKV